MPGLLFFNVQLDFLSAGKVSVLTANDRIGFGITEE